MLQETPTLDKKLVGIWISLKFGLLTELVYIPFQEDLEGQHDIRTVKDLKRHACLLFEEKEKNAKNGDRADASSMGFQGRTRGPIDLSSVKFIMHGKMLEDSTTLISLASVLVAPAPAPAPTHLLGHVYALDGSGGSASGGARVTDAPSSSSSSSSSTSSEAPLPVSITMMASRVAALEAASQLTKPSHNNPRVRNDLSDLSSSASASASASGSGSGSAGNTDSAGSVALSRDSQFSGVEILQLAQLPFKDKALRLLTGLANDEGVIACMKKHGWRVGCLAELYPEGSVGEDPVCVLGLNENKGQRILLRIRTDNLEGFRSMDTIKKTLCHELAHNDISPHDGTFYALMSVVEKEIVALNWKLGKSRTLGSGSGRGRLGVGVWDSSASAMLVDADAGNDTASSNGSVSAAVAAAAAEEEEGAEEGEVGVAPMCAVCGCVHVDRVAHENGGRQTPPLCREIVPPLPPLAPAEKEKEEEEEEEGRGDEMQIDTHTASSPAPATSPPAESDVAATAAAAAAAVAGQHDAAATVADIRTDFSAAATHLFTSLDSSIAVALSMEGSAAIVEKLLSISECMYGLVDLNAWAGVGTGPGPGAVAVAAAHCLEALRLLLKITVNALNHRSATASSTSTTARPQPSSSSSSTLNPKTNINTRGNTFIRVITSHGDGVSKSAMQLLRVAGFTLNESTGLLVHTSSDMVNMKLVSDCLQSAVEAVEPVCALVATPHV